MQVKWLSTTDLVSLLDEYVPINAGLVRESCEDGTIPYPFAKRIPGRKQGHWRIAVAGLPQILRDVYELNAQEIEAIQGVVAEMKVRAW